MKLLVTGGLGFIGSNFIRYILNKYEDIELINLDKMGIGSNPRNLEDLKSDKRYSFIKGDLLDLNLISKLVKEVDG
jgi:dTDP-glucose 4,6-dehydratase